jgi:circadian clock protein KaiC
MEKIATGIEGLDEILFGGIPVKDQVIVAGGPGSGKTLLGFEILYRNAKKGIPGVLITLEENPDNVLKNAKEAFADFNDIDALISKNMLTISGEETARRLLNDDGTSTYTFGNMVADIEEMIKRVGAKLIVVDSISLFKLVLGDDLKYRRSMLALTSNLKRLGVTSLLIAETPSSERSDLRFEPEYFIFDGILIMYQSGEGYKRTLTAEVVKMRGSDHSWALTPYEMTPSGFRMFTIGQS